MTDREKVIKGFECCHVMVHDMGPDKSSCGICPYKDVQTEAQIDLGGIECIAVLHDDALALLKKQEAEAKWIYGEDKTGVDGWYCSECNFFEPWFYEFTKDIDFIRSYGHCPKCGRKMTSYTGKPTQERR